MKNLYTILFCLIFSLSLFGQNSFGITTSFGISNTFISKTQLRSTYPTVLFGLQKVKGDFKLAYSIGIDYETKPLFRLLDEEFFLSTNLNLDYRNLYFGDFKDGLAFSQNIYLVRNKQKRLHVMLGFKHSFVFFDTKYRDLVVMAKRYLPGMSLQSYYRFPKRIKIGLVCARDLNPYIINAPKVEWRRFEFMLKISKGFSVMKRRSDSNE